MIWLIIAIILILIGIAIIVADLVFGSVNCKHEIGATLITCILMLSIVVYSNGYSRDYLNETESQRNLINLHIQYDEQIDVDVIKLINDYNVKIDRGNNLFCRFDIEDRSKDKIDVNTYLDKFKKGE